MHAPLYLAIDQGTQGTRALAIDESGRAQTTAYQAVTLTRRGPAMVEQDPRQILASVRQVITAIRADETVRSRGIVTAGLATQRSSVIAWDKRSGEPLCPVLSWQDRRAAAQLDALRPYAGRIKQCTGLPLSPHYGASKLRWCLEHIPAVKRAHREGYLAFGPLASYLLHHLLQGSPLLVDHANASRTQLWNIHTRDWDPWLLDLFGIPPGRLPQCRPICHTYGILKDTDIPLSVVNGDQTSAIYCLGSPGRTTAIVNIGTGAFLLLLTGENPVAHPTLLAGLARSDECGEEYTLEGTVNGAGAAMEWAYRQWGLKDHIRHLPGWLAREGAHPVFINTIGGLGSPWWRPGPEPSLVGNGEPWQGMVAVAESILFLLRVNIDAMEKAGMEIHSIRISGGLARLDGMCGRLADLTGRPVYRPAETEATARGTAWLAAGAPQRWPMPGRGRHFTPRENRSLSERYERFIDLLERLPDTPMREGDGG